MLIRRIAMSAAFAAGIAALAPAAQAQYYPLCNPFPLTWPFCVVGAAATIVTAPFRAMAAPPPYYYGYYGQQPYYYGPQSATAPAYGGQPAPAYGAAPNAAAPAYGGQPTPAYGTAPNAAAPGYGAPPNYYPR